MRRFALFDYGFRPFFLAAGMYALVVVPVWLYFFAHHAVPFGALPAMYWHAHELMYGFVVAAIWVDDMLLSGSQTPGGKMTCELTLVVFADNREGSH